MKKSPAQLTRRHFLLGASAATAATAAGIVAKTNTESASSEAKDGASKKGYQLTPHVQNYYRTAKI